MDILMDAVGQDENTWDEWWAETDIETQVRMWDFYGMRPYILKYVPRYGKSLEAGCGLSRYVFYLSKLGIEIEGLELSNSLVDHLQRRKKELGFDQVKFIQGNVTSLPYEDNSLSGCISLGVIEHFENGPQQALSEVYRVLRPGGVAIISTPSISYYVLYRRFINSIKRPIKKFLGKYKPEPFFQYEYRPGKLRDFVSDSGLFVTVSESGDLLYTFCEIGNFEGENLREGSFAYWFSNKFENTFINRIGAQSQTISVKVAKRMHCFLSGEKTANIDSLRKFTVPISDEYQENDLAKYYLRGSMTKYAAPYIISPEVKKPSNEICDFTGKEYVSDELFEDFGFTKKVSAENLKDPKVNIYLSNECTQPVWRRNVRLP